MLVMLKSIRIKQIVLLSLEPYSEDYHFVDRGAENYRIIGIFDGHGKDL